MEKEQEPFAGMEPKVVQQVVGLVHITEESITGNTKSDMKIFILYMEGRLTDVEYDNEPVSTSSYLIVLGIIFLILYFGEIIINKKQ